MAQQQMEVAQVRGLAEAGCKAKRTLGLWHRGEVMSMCASLAGHDAGAINSSLESCLRSFVMTTSILIR